MVDLVLERDSKNRTVKFGLNVWGGVDASQVLVIAVEIGNAIETDMLDMF